MSGADWRQEQELEEQYTWLESRGIDIADFIGGQRCAKEKRSLPGACSSSFRRGYNVQKGLEEVNHA